LLVAAIVFSVTTGANARAALQKSPSKPSGKSSPSKTTPARRAPGKKSGKKEKGKTNLSASGVPMTGVGPAMPTLDDAILQFIEKSRCTGATLAVSKDGQLLYSRGYGWMDAEKSKATPADAMFRVASISKPITAAAIRQLIRNGKLSLDDKVWDVLEIKPPAGVNIDPRWRDVTIAQLLDHKGGWDIKKLGFDPMFQAKRVAKELQLDHPAGPDDTVRWMLDKPLQFNPGERDAYSNFGYCLLGRVIEKVTRRPYLTYF
jgi:N-acyl-D-amino-acid deacylase